MGERKKNITVLIILLGSLILTGVIGYKTLLELDWIDALYMTVITISTVGYGEIGVMDTEAKLFSIILIFISLGTVGYLFSTIVTSFLEGDLKKAWRRRKMETLIKKSKDHYIVCGVGETGYNAIKQFIASGVPFVAIDNDEEVINQLIDENIPAILGESSDEDTLNKANIQLAKGLISSLSNDAGNVYTVLTARQMNPKLHIVSRAINKNASEKLFKAGANNTISPNEIGGARMAALMLKPTVMSFLDVMTRAGDVILDLEEVRVNRKSDLLGLNLREAQIPHKTGLIILAIKKKDSSNLVFNPNPEMIFEEGDSMVVLGRHEQVIELRKIACDTKHL